MTTQRPRLRLTVADNAHDEEPGVVEGRAECVRERISELAAFVDAARGLWRHMARDASGERELPEEKSHPELVLRDVRVDLAVGPFEVRVGDDARAPVARTRDEDGVDVALYDGTVGVRVDEVQARGLAPVAEQARLDVLDAQGLSQEGVLQQIDLADGW